MKRIAWVVTLTWLATGCGQSEAMRDARGHSAVAREALQKGDLDRAIRDLNESIEMRPTPEAYELRAEIHCQAGRTGQALDDANQALELWPSDAMRELRRHCEIEDARLRARFAEQNDALDRKQRELRQRLAKRQTDDLRSAIESSAFWSQRTRTERETYIQTVIAKGRERVAQEVFARQALSDSASADQEARIQGWLTELDGYHE